MSEKKTVEQISLRAELSEIVSNRSSDPTETELVHATQK
jgi:hypothetical protein